MSNRNNYLIETLNRKNSVSGADNISPRKNHNVSQQDCTMNSSENELIIDTCFNVAWCCGALTGIGAVSSLRLYLLQTLGESELQLDQ